MHSLTYKKDTPQVSLAKTFFIGAVGYVLLLAPDVALAQATNFALPGLDNVLCGIYTYLAKKILFYVALIVSIVGILAYLLKMSKEVWGLLFVIALLIGIAQGIGGVLASLGTFDVTCSAVR